MWNQQKVVKNDNDLKKKKEKVVRMFQQQLAELGMERMVRKTLPAGKKTKACKTSTSWHDNTLWHGGPKKLLGRSSWRDSNSDQLSCFHTSSCSFTPTFLCLWVCVCVPSCVCRSVGLAVWLVDSREACAEEADSSLPRLPVLQVPHRLDVKTNIRSYSLTPLTRFLEFNPISYFPSSSCSCRYFMYFFFTSPSPSFTDQ